MEQNPCRPAGAALPILIRMQVVADISVTPFAATGQSHTEVALLVRVLADAGLTAAPYSSGATVEGDYDAIVEALKHVHEDLHRRGLGHVVSTLRLASHQTRRPS